MVGADQDFARLLLRALSGSSQQAVVSPGTTWSGAELLAHAGSAAALLDRWGVGPGAVAALLTASPEAYALAVAGALTGRPLAPLNPRATPAEVAATVVPLGSSHLVVEPAAAELGSGVADRVPGLAVHVLDRLDPVDGLDARGAGDLAVILHTSGTTGLPRPVPVRHEPLAARVPVLAGLVDLGEGDLFCTGAPLHHVAGIGQGLVALAAGAGITTIPWFTAAAWDWVRQVRPTHVTLVPTMLEMLLADGRLDAGMRRLQYGAAPVRPATVRAVLDQLPHVRICQLFGQTEASPLTVLRHEDHLAAVAGDEALLGSVGRAVPGVELRLEDARDGVGEVVARAAHAFLTSPDGWVRTGDLGRLDEQGYLHLVGRRGDMIIRGGENVHPAQVEEVLLQHPGVVAAAVVGAPDDRLGEVPVAFVVPADGVPPPDEADLRAWARERLSPYKVPIAWHVREELPVSASGKLLRRVLAAELADRGGSPD